MSDTSPLAASYRDPSGRVFDREGVIYRTVSDTYIEDYRALMSTGLYEALTSRGLMVSHEEVPGDALEGGNVRVVLRPEVIPYISYPYEWSFTQLKDAALLTLEIAVLALDHGMVLKDASAYNVQFVGSKPVFIDTLSFERYVPGEPWIAYKQYTEHFFAPLALMALTDVRCQMLLRTDLDGIPVDLAAALLPGSSKFKPSLLMHIHGQAAAKGRYSDSDSSEKAKAATVSETQLRGILDSLAGGVRALSWKPAGTEWGDYYADTNYTDTSMQAKLDLVSSLIAEVSPKTAWDLGANTARFSRLAAEAGAYTLAFDIDPAAVEKAYLDAKERGDDKLLPLRMDLMNPSPSVGWRLAERGSFADRGKPDLILALALIHHISISRNVPLDQVAAFCASLAPNLIIEFVPKSDSQVRRLLSSRKDIFPDYHREGFEAAFASTFEIKRSVPVEGTERTMYLMEARDGVA